MGACASTPRNRRGEEAPGAAQQQQPSGTSADASAHVAGAPSGLAVDDASVALRIQTEKAAEALTPPKAVAIVVAVGLSVWLAIECIHEGIRITGGYGDPATVPMSPLRRAVLGNRNAISREICMQTAPRGCPLFKPMGDCTPFTAAFEAHPAHSLVLGHTLHGPHLALKAWADVLHVCGALCVYACALALALLGGPTFHGELKTLLVHNLLALPWQMLVTGSAMALLRTPDDVGYGSAALAPSEAWHSSSRGTFSKGAFSVWHELAAAGLLVALACGTLNSGIAEAVVFKVYPAPLVATLHGVSCAGWAACWPWYALRLCALPRTDWRWSTTFNDLLRLSLYPCVELPLVWALYWAWYRGREYDWDAHRAFAFATFVLLSARAAVGALTVERGILFASTVPTAWRALFDACLVGPWALAFYIPFVTRAARLPNVRTPRVPARAPPRAGNAPARLAGASERARPLMARRMVCARPDCGARPGAADRRALAPGRHHQQGALQRTGGTFVRACARRDP